MLLSLCALAYALLPGPRLATTRVGSAVLFGAGGDTGGATVSPLTTRASHPRRRSASRACLEDLGQLTVPQLKQRCREAGLKLSGRKAQLVQRLLDTEADTASSVEEASTESYSAAGSSTAAASAKLHGATELHSGASLPSATFSLVHADASLLVVDKGAGK